MGIVKDCLGDAEPLFHPFGIGPYFVMHSAGDADAFEHGWHAAFQIGTRNAQKGPVKVQKAGACVIIGEVMIFG